jgi:hypothetical protein
LVIASFIALAFAFISSPPSARAADADLPVTQARPLRYHPDARDFVIENGEDWYNRPLYGPHTIFHTDGGDKPEFVLLNATIKDGVLRLALAGPTGEKWLTDAAKITTRYRPGSLIYDIQDPMLGNATLHLTAVSLADSEGIALRAETSGTPAANPAQLVWIYGGVNGLRRNAANVTAGDVITATNVSSVRQIDENNGRDLHPQLLLQPDQCTGDAITLDGLNFNVKASGETMLGQFSGATALAVGDARKMQGLHDLLASSGSDAPLLIARSQLDSPVNLALWRAASRGATTQPSGTPADRFDAAEAHRESIADEIIVDTPDPFINAIPSALCIAGDAVWQPPVIVHGAVSWHTPLLGWRGAYINDALGWHDRADAYFTYWAGRQNTKDDFPTVAVPNPARGLSENDGGMLHSNGSIPQTHYDMNLVYIDALFRHLLWTGDKDMARKMWPVIQRHLAWEKRLFDRDGLYEGYACIWASDALQYNGGGAAHSTAYNEFHNRMAARVATWIGEDPAPYEAEADRIHHAMQSRLWMPQLGWYAEYLDVMGEKQLHPAAALWSIYHTVDSRVPDPQQAWEAMRYVDTSIAQIPVRGPGLPEGQYHVLPESNWMPYEWSLNNVVTGENSHTALAYWQAGRPEAGFNLLKSTMLDTMYLGMTPGNVPNLESYDPYRGESYTDFADPTGITSRALVEGLFGVRPDALLGELTIRPGFPLQWDHASFAGHDISYSFKLNGQSESWSVDMKFATPLKLQLQLPARGDGVQSVSINGQAVTWTNIDASVGTPWIEVDAPAAASHYDVTVQWRGGAPAPVAAEAVAVQGADLAASVAPAKLIDIADPQQALAKVQKWGDGFSAVATGAIGHRTVFAKVQQGDLTWSLPLEFDLRPGFEIVQSDQQDAGKLRFRIRNNTAAAVNGPAKISFDGQEVDQPISAASLAESSEITVPLGAAPVGTTHVKVDLGQSGAVEGDILNWQSRAGSDAKLEMVDLTGVLNDSVTRIFQNEYLTPRPQTCSLQMPIHGIGDWTGPTKTYAVDDSGLRRAAGSAGKWTSPPGVPFKTPGDAAAKNIAYTSQYDNYPRQITAPLTGHARHAYFLLAGSTNAMESQLENGEIVIAYADGTIDRLALRNPTNWWPIDKNYRIDDYAFRRPGPVPMRVALATGTAYLPETENAPRGGSGTVLDLPLNPAKELSSVTLHTESYEIVMGLMAVTLDRP